MWLRSVGKIVGAGWRIVAVSIALAMATAFGSTLMMTPVYESRVQMFVSISGPTYSSDVYVGNLFSQQAISAYAQLVKGDVITSRVVSDLALDFTPAELADKVTMTYSPETVVFDIVATDASPELARDIANTSAVELSAVVAELEAPQDGEAPSVVLRTLREAGASNSPISPNTVAYLVWGAAAGLLIGIALALVRYRSNRPAP